MIDKDTAEALFTTFRIMKDPMAANPDTAPRVAPSRVIEVAADMARAAARDAAEGEAAAKQAVTIATKVEKDVAALTQKIDALATGGVTEEMLETVLRRIYGSLDGVSPPPGDRRILHLGSVGQIPAPGLGTT